MSQGSTPYDTGERLQPRPWIEVRGQVATPVRWCDDAARKPEAEDFGRVDFDNERGRTVLTVHVTSGPTGYVVHIEDVYDLLTVTGDTEALVIGLEHAPGVEELLSLAERGREDFLYQARHGDYSPQDQADAANRWAAARAAAAAIRTRLH